MDFKEEGPKEDGLQMAEALENSVAAIFVLYTFLLMSHQWPFLKMKFTVIDMVKYVMYSWMHKYTTIHVKGRCKLKPVLDESLPIYQQIADMIMDDIIDGQIEEDEKIPSENDIAQFFSINRATIRKGLQVLLDMDLIYKRRGIGMFVKKGARAKLIRERQSNYTDVYIRPLLEEAKRIGLDLADVIQMIKEVGRS